MPEVEQGGLRIRYDDGGQGEPALLFLPGWCGSRKVFDELARHCARRRRALALDWRGHGESARPAGDFGADDLANDALAVIEASRTSSAVPVALSHAGWVALELRRRLGARIPNSCCSTGSSSTRPRPFSGR